MNIRMEPAVSEKKEKEGKKELPPLRAAHRHTVQMKLFPQGDDADAVEWSSLDIQSESDDARSALMAYLREMFEDAEAISESRDGVFRVADEMTPGVTFERLYRLG